MLQLSAFRNRDTCELPLEDPNAHTTAAMLREGKSEDAGCAFQAQLVKGMIEGKGRCTIAILRPAKVKAKASGEVLPDVAAAKLKRLAGSATNSHPPSFVQSGTEGNVAVLAQQPEQQAQAAVKDGLADCSVLSPVLEREEGSAPQKLSKSDAPAALSGPGMIRDKQLREIRSDLHSPHASISNKTEQATPELTSAPVKSATGDDAEATRSQELPIKTAATHSLILQVGAMESALHSGANVASQAQMGEEKRTSSQVVRPAGGNLGSFELQPEHQTVDAVRTIATTHTALEIGLSSHDHGWVRIRAELNVEGEVSAQVVPSSKEAAASLHKDLPSLTAYLSQEHVGIASLSIQQASRTEDPVQAFREAGENAPAMPGMGGGGSGTPSGQQRGQEPATKLSPLDHPNVSGVASTSLDFQPSVGGSRLPAWMRRGEQGSWLNVQA